MSTTNFLLKNNITIVRVQNITKSLILQNKLIYIEYRQWTQWENKSKLSEHLNCVYAKVYIKNFACKLRFLIQYLKINFIKMKWKFIREKLPFEYNCLFHPIISWQLITPHHKTKTHVLVIGDYRYYLANDTVVTFNWWPWVYGLFLWRRQQPGQLRTQSGRQKAVLEYGPCLQG